MNRAFRYLIIPLILLIVVGLMPAENTFAASDIIVTSGADAGAGTLRQAILDATSGQTIGIDPSVGSITLTSTLAIGKNLTIYASGTTINTPPGIPGFEVQAGSTLSLYNADVTGPAGSGNRLRIAGTLNVYNSSVVDGSTNIEVLSTGTLLLDSSIVSGATFRGVASAGTTTISNSTLSGNWYSLQVNSGTTTVQNSTMSGDYRNIEVIAAGTLNLSHVTLVGAGERAISNAGTTNVSNSLVDSNNVNCANTGTINDNGGNVEQGTGTCGFATVDPDPQVNGLADNGGPTQTREVLNDAANGIVATCATVTTDQRGVSRPGSACDAGAYDNGTVSFTSAPTLAFQNTTIAEDGAVNAELILNIPAGVVIARPITVTLRDRGTGTVNGSLNGTIAATTVTFDCGGTDTCDGDAALPVAKTIVTPSDDAIAAGDDTIDLLIESASGPVVYSPAIQTITITDDEVPGYAFNNVPTSVSETVGTFSYDLQLNTAPAGVVEITATGTAGVCTVNSPVTLDNTNYNDPANDFTVTVIDNAVGGDQVCTITYALGGGTTATEYSTLGAPTATNVTIQDDESNNVIVSPQTSPLNVGSAMNFGYSLTVQPLGNVVIDVAVASGPCNVAPTQITFTPANYNVAQDMTVTTQPGAVAGQTCTVAGTINQALTTDEYDAVSIVSAVFNLQNTPGTGTGTPGTPATGASDSVWAIDLSAVPAFSQPGGNLNFVIVVSKLSGGTPVTVSFPVPAEFVPGTPTSTRGSVNISGQTVAFSDDINAGESATITVPVSVSATVAVPFNLTAQACIISPVTLCDIATVTSVGSLPITGETPAYAGAVLDWLEAASIDAEQATAGITLEDLGISEADLEALGITVDDLTAIGVTILK